MARNRSICRLCGHLKCEHSKFEPHKCIWKTCQCPGLDNTLTDREIEIVKLYCAGKSTKDIAYELNLSIKTINSHRFNIYEKVDVGDLVKLIHFALRKKIIDINFCELPKEIIPNIKEDIRKSWNIEVGRSL